MNRLTKHLCYILDRESNYRNNKHDREDSADCD